MKIGLHFVYFYTNYAVRKGIGALPYITTVLKIE